MANIVDSLNRRIEKQLKKNIDKQGAEKEDTLQKYKEYQSNRLKLQGSFDISSVEGDLYYIDNDVTVVLENEEISYERSYFGRGASNGYNLNIPLDIEVKHIDEEKRMVYVRCTEQIDTIRERCIKILNKEVWQFREANKKYYEAKKEGKELPEYKVGRKIRGTIVSVDNFKAVVDILGLGIRGEIVAPNWSLGYIDKLDAVCKVGESHIFEVIGYLPKKRSEPDEQQGYRLSRKHLVPDPWKTIPKAYADVIKAEETLLLVKCRKIIEGQNWFWGEIEKLESISIFCDYPNKFKVEEGKTYRCVVKEFDPENHKFKVIPVALAQSCDIGIDVIKQTTKG